MNDGVWILLKEFCNEQFLNYCKQKDFFSIGNVKYTSQLGVILTTLSLQNEYDVIIETERKNDEIIYSIGGERNGI